MLRRPAGRLGCLNVGQSGPAHGTDIGAVGPDQIPERLRALAQGPLAFLGVDGGVALGDDGLIHVQLVVDGRVLVAERAALPQRAGQRRADRVADQIAEGGIARPEHHRRSVADRVVASGH